MNNRVLLYPLLLVLTACAELPFFSKDTITIKKSPNDHRVYRYLVLDNQLRVLLVNDSTADKAAASLDVHVGSRHDPAYRQGLAHFLEHMLFLGTKKYPEPDSYQQFISENGGSHNAYTALEHTNYFFDINNNQLNTALDRFADFFVSPSLNEDYVQREMQAVESEYRARIKDEDRRVVDATQQVYNVDSPFRQFSVGSLQTLSAPGIRTDLTAFYQRYYSADRMSLAVVGNYSLDQLEAMVRGRFNRVPNHDNPVRAVDTPLFSSHGEENTSLPLMLSVEAEKPIRQLRFTFPMPDIIEAYRTKPLSYIGNILGHEGRGSLLSALKANGLAESLSAGVGMRYKGGATFQLNIALSPEGLAQVKQVADKVFYAIQLLRQQQSVDPDRLAALFREQQYLSEIAFRFYEQPSVVQTVLKLSANMQFYPASEVIIGDYDYSDYHPPAISDRLARLTPDNVLLTVIADELPEGLSVNDVSHWFAAPYAIRPVPDSWLDQWRVGADLSSGSAAITLPEPNDFIPRSFELVDAKPMADRPIPNDLLFGEPLLKDAELVPEMVVDQPGFRLWVKTDDDFEVPKADVTVGFQTPYPRQSPRHQLLAQLYVSVISERLNEFIYPAYLVGMDLSYYSSLRGFVLKVGGYNDSLAPLLNKIVPALDDVTLDKKRFLDIKVKLRQHLQLALQRVPYRRLSSLMSTSLYVNAWDEAELMGILDEIDQQELQHYVNDLWQDVFVEAMVHGNVDERGAIDLTALLRQLPNCRCDSGKRSLVSIVDLPRDKRWQQSHPMVHRDAAVHWYFQAPDDEIDTTALSLLTSEVLHPRFFHSLRTEQQLGYVVGVDYFPLHKRPGLRFMVQSPSFNEIDIVEAIDGFVQAFIEQPPDLDDFLRHRSAVAGRLTEVDANLRRRSQRYWHSIALGDRDFDRRQRLAEHVKSLQYDDWRRFAEQLLLNDEASIIRTTRTTDIPRFSFPRDEKSLMVDQWPNSGSLPEVNYP